MWRSYPRGADGEEPEDEDEHTVAPNAPKHPWHGSDGTRWERGAAKEARGQGY